REREEQIHALAERSARERQDGERALREARGIQAEQRERLRAVQEQREQLRQQEQRLQQANPSPCPSPGRPRREPGPFPTGASSFPARQERRSLARQRERLLQLRDELAPGALGTLLETGPASALGLLRSPSAAAPAAPGARGLLPGLLPPVGMFLGDGGERLGSAALYGHLLLLKHRAQMDHDFLENEQIFLESLKKGP
ncbi:FBF1 factor, partial [Orthonyx spaldingii]|nr:FBF1 factor [Orthonyx spaldingii]